MGPEAMPFVIVALFVAVIIVLAVVSAKQAAKRREELRAWATQHGMTFDEAHRSDLEGRFPRFDCLRQGSNRYAYNVLEGRWGDRSFLGFDYHYETHSHDSKGRRQTHHNHFSAVILGSDLPLQPLSLRRENFFDKIGEFFGADDIDFESAEFSRNFCVRAPDKRWAYDVLHARTMEFLLASPVFSLKFDRHCVIAQNGSVFSPQAYEDAVGVIAGVLDRLPDYLVRQQRELSADRSRS